MIFFNKQKPLVTVGALIVAPDQDILLVQAKKWKNCWTTPGGKVEWGETRQIALEREIWEETNLKVINSQFALAQDCIFSSFFWQKKHFVMNDYLVELSPNCQKSDVKLNDEAQIYQWVKPHLALKMNLTDPCRRLIEWYLQRDRFKNSIPTLIGIDNLSILCIVGINPEERHLTQELLIDIQVHCDLSECKNSKDLVDSINYVEIADLCTQLAKRNHYDLIETFAFEIIDECFKKFPVSWVKVKVKKPQAIKQAQYAFVEYERKRKEGE